MDSLWFSPLFVTAIYFVLVLGLYWFGGVIGAKGDASEDALTDKHLPYTGGELPTRPPETIGYQAFFRLALLFAILHVAVLVLSTVPSTGSAQRLALIYLGGIAISVFVLTAKEE